MLVRKRSPLAVVALLLLAAAVSWFEWQHRDALGFEAPAGAAAAPAEPSAPDDDQRLAALAAAHHSGVEVEVTGRVVKLLPDDTEGDRHQRFLLQVGDTPLVVLVAHNIDLGARVPVAAGDTLRVHGEYEWNDKGGVLHWTHRNPAQDPRHESGWIERDGRRYE